MNVCKTVLLTLSAAALCFGAPALAQGGVKNYYALEIEGRVSESGSEGAIFFAGGRANMPVALMVGAKEIFVPIPGDATLRLDPIAIFVLGRFDDKGTFTLSGLTGEVIEPVRFFVQGLSIDANGRFLTTELMEIHTNLSHFWRYEYFD